MMHGTRFFTYGGYMRSVFWASGWNWLILIGALLVIAAAIYLIVKGVKSNRVDNEAIEALNLKFAKGEITEEEYLKRRNILEDK